MLYLHGRNPLVPDGNNYIITGDSGQVGARPPCGSQSALA